MARPGEIPEWATDANYPAGAEPEAATPTKVAYTLGQAALGWRPKGKPPAQELNRWQNLVGQWLDWLDQLTGPKWKWRSGATFTSQDTTYGFPVWGVFTGFAGTAGQTPGFTAHIDEPVGARITSIKATLRHVAAEPNGGNLGKAQLMRVAKVADGVGGNNGAVVLATVQFVGNNAAGALWETKETVLGGGGHVIEDGYEYFWAGLVSGVQVMGSVGYEVTPMD